MFSDWVTEVDKMMTPQGLFYCSNITTYILRPTLVCNKTVVIYEIRQANNPQPLTSLCVWDPQVYRRDGIVGCLAVKLNILGFLSPSLKDNWY